jgi:hypothetical protein
LTGDKLKYLLGTVLERAMSDLLVRDLDDRALAVLEERARSRGVLLDGVIREILENDALLSPTAGKPEPPLLSEQERIARNRVAARMAEIRSRTLKPLWADSALLIREDRDKR